ncbi:MAG: hypothetical protein ACOCX2_06115 [Armatimonadota bacterium]
MLRGRTCVMAFVLLGAMSICAAQEAADILVGDEVVARVREAGTYDSVEHRAAAVDEKINEVLAGTDDPGALDVTLEKVDDLWTVMIDGTPIVAVYPSEAEANGMTPEMLGAGWVRRFKDALPEATGAPVTEIGAPAATEDPAETTTEPVQPLVVSDEPVISSPTTGDEPAASTDTETPADTPADGPTDPPAETDDDGNLQILELSPDDGDEEEIVAGQGARLLILEAFNKSRDLPEDDYLVRREAMANDLFDDLVQVLTDGRATGRLEGSGTASPSTASTPADTEPENGDTAPTPDTAPPPTTIDTGPVTSDTEPTTVGTAPSLEMSDEARAKIRDHIPANDPSYANVVQKVAINAKFHAASASYRDALQNDPATGTQAREVLSAARRAFNDGDFNTAERYLDTGLRLLGVTGWEEHIDAAMADLGLLD